MARSPIWRAIADTLTADIARAHYGPGDRLPTEAELAGRFGVNRHTVRHALAALADQGLIHTRRGSGAFVAARPTDYALGRRTRFHQNLAAAGLSPGRELTRRETRPCDAGEAEALHLPPGAAVHVIEGISLADGVPVATFRSVFPADHLPGLLARLEDTVSITAALAAEGVADYTRASTRLTAIAAPATLALALRLPEGAPILRSTSVNIDPSGRPLEFGTTWFAGDRVTLTVTPD